MYMYTHMLSIYRCVRISIPLIVPVAPCFCSLEHSMLGLGKVTFGIWGFRGLGGSRV